MTPEQILTLCPRAGDWAAALCLAASEWEINTPRREAHFVAQVGHESAGLTRFEENLRYSAPRLLQVFPRHFPHADAAAIYASRPERIANRVYADRMGNGPEESGDGWRYRGRGPIQITGRDNYRLCGEALNMDLLARPDALLEPGPGSASAAWYFATRCLEAADRDDVSAVTRCVNGGTHGLAERAALTKRAFACLA